MAITQSFTANAGGNTASGSITVPAAMPVGAVGVVIFTQNNADVLTAAPSWLTEFTPAQAPSTSFVVKCYWFTVGGGTAGTVAPGTVGTFTMSATRAWTTSLYGVVGATNASPVVVLAAVGTNNATSAVMPTVTTTETLWLAEVAIGKANGASVTSWTIPAGWTARVNQGSPTTFGAAVVIADRNNGIAGAGAYGGETYTTDAAINVSVRYLIGFRPAPVTLTYYYPTTDTGAVTTGWTPVGATSFWDALDDSDNGTYAESPANPSGSSPLTIPIRPVQVPTDTSTVQVPIDLWSVNAASATAVVSLAQSGTTKKTWGTLTLTSTPTTYRLALTATEVGTLTATSGSYQNLTVTINPTAS